jgi:protein-disulfide isomerase
MPYVLASLLIVLVLTGALYRIPIPERSAQQIASALVNGSASVPHFRGAMDAPLTLVEYGDYECPPCATFNPVLWDLLQRYGNKLRLEYRHYPLTPHHPNAVLAAAAAEAAGEQGRYWEMNDLLFDTQSQWAHTTDAEQKFVALAGQLGLNKARFIEALHSPSIQKRVSNDMHIARESEFGGTPTFLLNGRRIDVPRATVEQFAIFIDAALNGNK